MKRPIKVKFIGYKSKNTLYKSGFKRNKMYTAFWDEDGIDEVYNEFASVTVTDDNGDLHEIEKEDYEVKEWENTED